MENNNTSDYWDKFVATDRPIWSWLEHPTVKKFVDRRVTQGNDDEGFWPFSFKYLGLELSKSEDACQKVSSFDEQDYIERYPDVAQKIAEKVLPSARAHYFVFGKKEGRTALTQTNLKILVLGCGLGKLERDLIRYEFIQEAHGIDFSKVSIENAKVAAKKEKFDKKLKYFHADLNKKFPEELDFDYDVVICDMVLHHIENPLRLLKKVKKYMHSQSFLLVNEYVGPNRFQHSSETVELVNAFLNSLPDHLKVEHINKSSEKKLNHKNINVADLIAADPSEAINSERVLPSLRKLFDENYIKSYGGNIVHMLFSGIIANFKLSEEADNQLIRNLLLNEMLLEKQGIIQPDFIVGIYTLKKNYIMKIRHFFETKQYVLFKLLVVMKQLVLRKR